MIGRAKTSARQRCRFSAGRSRAGFEPKRWGGLVYDCSRPLTIVSKQSSINIAHTQRLKSGAESTLPDSGNLGRAEIFALPILDHLPYLA